MGWFSKDKENEDKNKNVETVNEPVLTNYSKGQKILMQDKPPRFDPESSNSGSNTSGMMKNALETINWKDFSLAKLTEIPCFRDAGMVGFSSMFILGSITLLYHKNPIKATNWATGGLFLGSIVGWEQCRMKRKKSMEISTMAMQTMQEKKRKEAIAQGKLPAHKEKKEISPEKLKEIEILKKEWENHPNDSSFNLNSKPWYKFW
ncbi:similar to Saccharomyces cerevisiae YDR231C COX20 Mitochondrial inner membrane protein, required for proteolytic processing of Cox2p and its assembly into cytochrome c oxidase [Maudiozyma saulgeensis]|uniref:Cytochrome c oxidase assembly protein COX20, mitochondrial n=1 Tax=Maudiozyma saulgeensis TaxID=1789683 RepID=A0A1X7R5G7_9SACH|nr:similar to Saccharomyces cerevisiae YDR231C COX20 Mitochondrial inner membrane protein, required for proteolytic processing of Cox2p and its assembly into cytochrome c oxidase [Kazachstania saulgeensis]